MNCGQMAGWIDMPLVMGVDLCQTCCVRWGCSQLVTPKLGICCPYSILLTLTELKLLNISERYWCHFVVKLSHNVKISLGLH